MVENEADYVFLLCLEKMKSIALPLEFLQCRLTALIVLANEEFSQVFVVGVARKLGQAKRHESDLNDLLLDQR